MFLKIVYEDVVHSIETLVISKKSHMFCEIYLKEIDKINSKGNVKLEKFLRKTKDKVQLFKDEL